MNREERQAQVDGLTDLDARYLAATLASNIDELVVMHDESKAKARAAGDSQAVMWHSGALSALSLLEISVRALTIPSTAIQPATV